MSVSYCIRQDGRRILKDDTLPIKLWITHKRRSIPYSTVFSLTVADFKKLSSPNIGTELKAIRQGLKDLTAAFEDYLKNVGDFDFEKFNAAFLPANRFLKPRKRGQPLAVEVKDDFDLSIYEKKFRIFKEPNPSRESLLGNYLEYIMSLLRIKSIKTADIYQSTYFSLKAFRSNVKLREITSQYLKEYDLWMREQGRKKSTIGMYLRTLRRIFNEAIEAGIVLRKDYPFGRKKYIIPSGSNVKKALSKSWIEQIYYYKPTSQNEAFARDTWLFLYFGNGMNPKDMVSLKYKNIKNGYIVFERNKTATTARENSKPITVYITNELQAIIDKWGMPEKSLDGYIFSVFKDCMNPMQQMLTLQNFVKFTNENMKKIFNHLGIEHVNTTIAARHSYSTHMLFAGAPKELIQESLGHHNIKTTENYLASFEKDVVKQFANKLVAFKHQQ